MKYEHGRTLIEFAKLNLEIAISRNPSAAMDVSPAAITRSKGYKRLRGWFVSISPRKREIFIRDVRAQMTAIRAVLAEAKRTGEKLAIGEIEISTFDDKGAPLAAPPKMGEGLE